MWKRTCSFAWPVMPSMLAVHTAKNPDGEIRGQLARG
jgi:hypothetical protein